MYYPSKHAGSDRVWSGSELCTTPVNMPDLIASDPDPCGSTGQKWAQWFLHTGLLPDWTCLAKTWHSQPKPNRIWSGFAQYDPGHLWKNATESERGKLVVVHLYSARIVSDSSCKLARLWTSDVWPKPDRAIQTGSGSALYNMIQAFFGKSELNQTATTKMPLNQSWHVYRDPNIKDSIMYLIYIIHFKIHCSCWHGERQRT